MQTSPTPTGYGSRSDSGSSARTAGMASSLLDGVWMLVTNLGSRLFTPSRDKALRRLADSHLGDGTPLIRLEEMELRDVELARPYERWPSGTRGVIVDAFETDATVEIADHDGRTVDLLTLPYDALVFEDSHEHPLLI